MSGMYRNSFLMFLLLGIFFWGCKQSQESKKVSKVKIDSVVSRLGVLEDSIGHSWEVMSRNEEEMFFNIKRLLQEIGYIPGHDPKPLDTLMKAAETAQNLRYDQETMRESTRIDKYDEAVANVVNGTLRYAGTVISIEKYQVAKQLMDEIPQQYQHIYLNRVHYDFNIQDYNELLSKNRKRLEKFNPKYKEAKPKAMFQLQG